MLVADLFYNGKGIFHYINETKPLTFIEDIMGVDELDILFSRLYGNREVSLLSRPVNGVITEEHMQQLGALLSVLFHDKWERLYETLNAKISLETYNLKTVENIVDSGEVSSNTTNEHSKRDSKSVSAYNDDIMIDDSLDEREGIDTTNNTGTTNNNRERITTVSGNIKNSLDDRIKAINYLKNNLLYDIIFVDVAQKVGKLIF
jgi:hypothetical protein